MPSKAFRVLAARLIFPFDIFLKNEFYFIFLNKNIKPYEISQNKATLFKKHKKNAFTIKRELKYVFFLKGCEYNFARVCPDMSLFLRK